MKKNKKQKMKVVYTQAEEPDQEAVNKAYDILFEEVLRLKKEKRKSG
jgi:hypothetical protein